MRSSSFFAASILMAALATPACSQSTAKNIQVKNGVVTTDQFVKTRKGGQEISCEDFLDIENKYKPQAISYIIGYNKARNPSVKAIDISAVDTLTPVIVSTCKSHPKGSLHDTVSTVIYKR
ncbi:HdeA/HdeB family chaperone [Sphingomonas echinoides]|jgi:hypothetical protein|uniref:HdeA/HdeB family chaperone n=1 Tax=Sphingomonas echinoides TaxID=59803 RepID=A0ABU4PPZ1_9SPHN|nr:HdeA/HdeB family chaperone [Sphingomonas echinoides]MDX5986216.1 HdeA/HdeB family chaperone [Sphingomonas echinoides]